MSTTMIVNSKKVKLSVQDKARGLTVFEIGEAGRLAVTSGSQPNTAYLVKHDGQHSTFCPCGSYAYCSHKQAADWHLEALNRAVYVEKFGLYCC